MSEFAVTDLFQCRTFAREVFVEFTLTGNTQSAARTALPQLGILCVIGLIIFVTSRKFLWDLDVAGLEWIRDGRRDEMRLAPRAVLRSTALLPAIAIIFISVALPLASLIRNAFSSFAWTNLAATVLTSQIMHTVQYAGVAAVACVLLGAITSICAERIARPWRPLLYAIAIIPFAFPPSLYAVGVSALMSNVTVVDDSILASLPLSLSYAARFLPLTLLVISMAFRISDRVTEDSARIEGESDWRAPLRLASVPALYTIAGAFLLVFTLSAGDVAHSSLLYPPGGEPISVAIFNAMHYSHEPEVAVLCLVLTLMVMAPGLIAFGVCRRIYLVLQR